MSEKKTDASKAKKPTSWDRIQKDLRAQSATKTRETTLAERKKLMEKQNG